MLFWYLYTVKEELQIGQVTELELYSPNSQLPPNNTDTKNLFADTTINQDTPLDGLNEIIQPADLEETEELPETWRLIQIHTEPTVGASITDGLITFIDQKTGNVLESNKGDTSIRLSSITVQHVKEAYTLPDGSVLILRKNTTPTQVHAEVDTDRWVETESSLIDDMIQVSQSGSYIYYSSVNSIGGIDVKSTKDTSQVLWSSSLSQWLLQAVDEYIVLTQNASYNIPGYAYLLPKQGVTSITNTTPIAQDLPGLITNVSPDASQLLYSTSGKTGTTLYLKDLSDSSIIPLSIKTLASKCTWGSDNVTFYCAIPETLPDNLPDSWYMGQAHLADNLWRINATTGDAFELAHATSLDIINLVEDGESGVVVFKNKTDQSLWAVVKNDKEIKGNTQ